MSLPPLLRPCPSCQGTGAIPNPAWQRYFAETHNQLYPENDPVHPWPAGPEEEPCPDCEGRGQVATTAGMQVLELVRWAEGRP